MRYHLPWKNALKQTFSLKAACIAIAAIPALTLLASLMFVPLHRASATAVRVAMALNIPVMVIGAGMTAAGIAWAYGVMFRISPIKALLIVFLLPLGLVYTPGMSEGDRERFEECGELLKRGILAMFAPMMILLVFVVGHALMDLRGH